MELYIDNRRADIDAGAAVAVSLSISAITDPRKGRTGYTRSLCLPMTPLNAGILGFAEEIHASDRFNAREHTGRLEHEGAVLIEGPLYLNNCERTAEGGVYVVHIVGASKEWAARAAAHALRGTDVEYSETITGQKIMQSWTADTPVRFLPVLRERAEADFSSGSVIPAVKILSADDYHPFIHAATLLKAIFAESGYTIESEFIDGDEFNRLYISGNYPTSDVTALKANMDFFARRYNPKTATADHMGRVYANPYVAVGTVGNIVDSADPSFSMNGVSYDDVFSKNGCFQMDDDRVAFVPTGEISVGFLYYLRYTTEYYMKNRQELTGFNRVYVGEASPRIFKLANPYPDRRNNFRNGRTYRLAVFGFTAGYQYQLRYTRQTQTGGTSVISSEAIGVRFAGISISTTLAVSDPVLYYRTSSAGTWSLFTGDWALYDGFVEERGKLDVELTVRSAPETVSRSRPKFFDDIYFGGADPGMTITVSDKIWIRPVFYAQPTELSAVSFADVAAHDATQMDFINSLRQMFNLCFHTDSRAKTVRIEPRARFYSDAETVNWTNRLDLSKPVTVEELGADLARQMVWSYATGDGAVTRYNRSAGEQMGLWSAAVENCAAKDGESVWENPMFTCSLNAEGWFRSAPSASLVQAGLVTAAQPDRTEDLNFAPKIVRYDGLTALPSGETWGWPSDGTAYPKLAFHNPADGFTLCFEDRGGARGLHKWFDRDVKLWNRSKRIAMWLNLDPADIESLSFPTGWGPDFRKLYRIDIDGEEGLYRLEEVCGYNPSASSTKCIFIKHIP